MKRALTVLVTAVLVCMPIGRSAAAAQEPSTALVLGPVDAATYPELAVRVTAPAELSGQELAPGSIQVIENGQEQPSSFTRLPDDRLEVVLVIDTSGSMKGSAFSSATVAASAFIARLPLDARVALVSFGSSPSLASPMVDDRNLLLGAIRGLQPRGETALYDAVVLATQQFSAEADIRRSIVVLSDGGDTASATLLDDAAAAVVASGGRLDVVELVTEESDRSALDKLSSAGNGRVVPADDPTALAGIYDGLAASLANEYTLSWRSSSHGPTDVTVRLEHGGVAAESTIRLEYPALPTPPAPATTTPPQASVEALPPVTATGDVARWALVIGASCIAVALFLLGQIAFAPRRRRFRLGRLGSVRRTVPDSSAISGLVERATSSADAVLERHGRRGALNNWLERAGIALRPGEYVVLALSAIAIGFAGGFVVSGLIPGVLLAALAAALLYFVPQVMADRRRQRFSEQLPETLQLLSGSLRAGYGLLQAIEMLGRECPEPTGGEFRRLVVESRLGRDIAQSLEAMSRRIGTEDFAWVVQAIDIHREVGGDLAEVLDTVAATIRERNQVMRQVKTLTAEGRLSAYILTALPVVLAVALRLINPDYFDLLTHGAGLAISASAAGLLVVGAVWFRKLCQLDY